MSDTWAISQELYDWIVTNLPQNRTILELGSGEGTNWLSNHFEMISIEHDPKYLNRYRSRYIHAPIQAFRKQCGVFPNDQGWYDREVLRRELPRLKYDMILIDGPPNKYGRGGFYKWRELFNLNVPLVFDDVQRERETKLIRRISACLKRPYTVYATWTVKHFGVILP